MEGRTYNMRKKSKREALESEHPKRCECEEIATMEVEEYPKDGGLNLDGSEVHGVNMDFNLLEKEEEAYGIILRFSAKWGLKGDRNKGKRKMQDALGFIKKKRDLFKKRGNQKRFVKESRPNFLKRGNISKPNTHKAKDFQVKHKGFE